MDYDVLSRLHDKGYIVDPVNKTKSVRLTEAGIKASERLTEAGIKASESLFKEMFSKL